MELKQNTQSNIESEKDCLCVRGKGTNVKNFLTFITDTYEEANQILQKHEQTYGVKFATWIQSKGFGQTGIYLIFFGEFRPNFCF